MADADSRKVVLAALAGNVAIAALKFAAAILSHSSATLAEAVHSLADAGNQGLLLVGMSLAARPASDRFPFGRASERYFWPFVVAMVLFSGGGAFAIFDGIQTLRRPEIESHARGWSYAVLSVSLVVEALSLRVAMGEFRKLAAGRSVRQAVLETRDPTVPLVLAEDVTAMAGLVRTSGIPSAVSSLGSCSAASLSCSPRSRTVSSSARAPPARIKRAFSSLRLLSRVWTE
jgi:hypothetical protein